MGRIGLVMRVSASFFNPCRVPFYRSKKGVRSSGFFVQECCLTSYLLLDNACAAATGDTALVCMRCYSIRCSYNSSRLPLPLTSDETTSSFYRTMLYIARSTLSRDVCLSGRHTVSHHLRVGKNALNEYDQYAIYLAILYHSGIDMFSVCSHLQ